MWKDKPADFASPREAIDAGIGMVQQHFSLVNKMTVLDNIVLNLKDNSFFLDRAAAKKKLTDLAEKYGLYVNPDAVISDLSVGEQQRVEILKALYRNVELLILDEPTAGLDVMVREEILDLLREFMIPGDRSILISSHISSDLEGLCDDIYLIDQGQIHFHEQTDVLMEQYGILKVTPEQYETLDKEWILKEKEESYGYACLTNQKQYYMENWPQIAVEKGSVDQVMMIMAGGR